MTTPVAYSAKEFLTRLKSGELQTPPEIVGIVKMPDTETGHILFSAQGCKNWVKLPESLLANVEHLGTSPCDDHSHPRVRLSLNHEAEGAGAAILALVGHFASAARKSLSHTPPPHLHAHVPSAVATPPVSLGIARPRFIAQRRGLFRLF